MAESTSKYCFRNYELPDGRVVDLSTNEGAIEYLEQTREFRLFSASLKKATSIRQKRRLSGKDKDFLWTTYMVIYTVAQHSPREQFHSLLPKAEIEDWIQHVIEQLQRKTNYSRWICTGVLEDLDHLMVSQCIVMFQHCTPVALAFEAGFFQALNDFLGFRKALCPQLAKTIVLIVFYTGSTASLDLKWRSEKIFTKLESSGMLAQFIRYSTVLPHSPPDSTVLEVYDHLGRCPVLLKHKFKKGQECGDLVNQILERPDGHNSSCPIIIGQLKTIASFVKLLVRTPNLNEHRRCHNCSEVDEAVPLDQTMSLLKCGKCKSAYYCSKECQRADWKFHKKQCHAPDENEASKTKQHELYKRAILNFINEHQVGIAVESVKKCDELGLQWCALVLELDFFSNEQTLAPAFQSPPIFRISAACEYVEDPTRARGISWFSKIEKKKRSRFEEIINDHMEIIHDSIEQGLLCVAYFPGEVLKIELLDPL